MTISNQIDIKSKVQSELESLVSEFGKNISVYFEKINPKDENFTLLINPELAYHPASLLKLFTAIAAYEKCERSEELMHAIKESLVVSDNDALGYVVDSITDTVSGPELSVEELKIFKEKRKVTTEFFHQRGYSSELNIPNKCFSFDHYGRDKQASADNGNLCTISDVAKVMKEISAEAELFNFLKRDIANKEDYQTKFIAAAEGLKKLASKASDFEFHSKAGWTSKVRHDAAIIDINSDKYLLIVMTKGLSKQEDLIPNISNQIWSNIL